jgi:two-component system sensor histidine kinase KdpD
VGIGKLTIFTSYTPGAGKSYFMLQCAIKEKQSGKNIRIGFFNANHRELPRQLMREVSSDCDVRTYSLAEIVLESPDIVIMDEMGMRGRNTDNESFVYEDIKVLLEHGIDVYTTVNLKRFASANPLFKNISGIGSRTIIPDEYLDAADRIYFIDRSPAKMEKDFAQKGFFCRKYQESKIMKKNFKLGNLEKYRELSLKYLKKYSDKVQIVTRE